MTKLILDDDGFAILGNALLLGYLLKTIALRTRESSEAEKWEDRREYSQRRELTERLDLAGAPDRRIAGNIDIPCHSETETVKEWGTRIVALANSDADIAQLRIKDIDFSAYWTDLGV